VDDSLFQTLPTLDFLERALVVAECGEERLTRSSSVTMGTMVFVIALYKAFSE
jgi:hypothetical protein